VERAVDPKSMQQLKSRRPQSRHRTTSGSSSSNVRKPIDSRSSSRYIKEGSKGGRIDKDIYRVSNREQEARRISRALQDDQESP
jgi:hypothetical protein